MSLWLNLNLQSAYHHPTRQFFSLIGYSMIIHFQKYLITDYLKLFFDPLIGKLYCKNMFDYLMILKIYSDFLIFLTPTRAILVYI